MTKATLPSGEQVELEGIDATTAARSNMEKPDLAALGDALEDAKTERRDAKDAQARGDDSTAALRKRVQRARNKVRDAEAALEEAREDHDVIDNAREAVAQQHEAEKRQNQLEEAALAAMAAKDAGEQMMDKLQEAQYAQDYMLDALREADQKYPGQLVSANDMMQLANYIPHKSMAQPEAPVPSINYPVNVIQGSLVPLIEDHAPERSENGVEGA
jgi:chromosome segregation ATPase